MRDRTAKQAFDAILALPGEHVIQINHPRLGRYGYFDQLHFDPATGVGSAPGYDARFDALEVWNGRHTKERDRVLGDLRRVDALAGRLDAPQARVHEDPARVPPDGEHEVVSIDS